MTYDFMNPPVAVTMSAGMESAALGWLSLLLALSGLLLMWRTRTRKRSIVMLCIVGGAAAAVFDAQLNVLTLRWFPAGAQYVLYTSSGREVPLFWACFQAWYVGCGAAWLITAHRSQATPREAWPAIWTLIVIRFGVELAGVHSGLWLYYGWQPFCVLGVPLWVPVTHAVAVVACARFIEFSLIRHRPIGLLIGVPLSWSIAMAMQTWPISLALNHRDSNVVLASVAMVAVMLMAGLFVEFLQRLSRCQYASTLR